MTEVSKMSEAVSVLICIIGYVRDERQTALFRRALESVLAQDSTAELRANILIVDNASPIPISSLIDKRVSSLVRVIRRQSNNIGAARSQAVAEALGGGEDWLAFVDSDIEIPPHWLLSLVREAQTGPMKDAVAIGTVNRPALENDFSTALDFLLGFKLVHLSSSQAMQLPSSLGGGILKMKVDHLSACAILLHTKAIAHAGGFDANFSRVCEDLEMCYRLKKNGSLWLLSGPVAIHRQDREMAKWSKRMFRYGWGQIEVARRHPEHLQTRKIIPLLAVPTVLVAIVLLAMGFTAPIKLLAVGYLGFIVSPIIVRGISERRIRISAYATVISFVTHASYAAGMCVGLLRLKKNPRVS